MKAILLFFLFAVSTTLASIQLPVHQHRAHKNALKSKQSKKLEKLTGMKIMRPRSHVKKLIEAQHITDYISANVSFGTPPQQFTVLLTSGSSRAWLFNKNNTEKLLPNIHTYNPDKSTTSEDLEKDFIDQVGSFGVLGTFFSDTLKINNITVPNQAFGYIDKFYNPDGANFPVDGVLGLNHLIKTAYKNNEEPVAPVDNILKALNHINVVYYLEALKPPSQGPSGGLVTIGGVDNEHCDYTTGRALTLQPKQDDQRWVFQISEVKYGDKKFGQGGSAFIDISVSNIWIPFDALQSIGDIIQPDYDFDYGVFTVPCNSSLEPIYFNQKDGSYVHIAPEHLIVDIELNNGLCALAIDSNRNNLGYNEEFILGAPVARSSCIEYDFNINQINVRQIKKPDGIFDLVKHRVVKIYGDVKNWFKKTFSFSKKQ